MLKHQLIGRLGLGVIVLVLANACTGGEISDASEGARGGPEGGDPEVGNGVAPLECAGASPDVSAQGGWRSHEASLPADDALRFELKARPTAAGLEGIVAVGAEDIDDFPKAAIAVRFDDNGLVDVRDGAFYSSDLAYPWDPGVWYSIAISADIDAKTYDVEIGPCGELRQKLIEDASFRDTANVSGQLSTWGVWSHTTAALEVSTPAWMTSSGGCTPATCLSLGHVCGTPQDGCGGTLSCGVCGDGEMCSSGTCTNPPPPPPPTGTPYGHVLPSDVGKTIGVGVVGPVPTIEYTGPNPITQNGTLLENRIINGELRIEADNVTVRNCIINASGASHGINIDSGDNVLIENNKINKGNGGKQIRVSSPMYNANFVTVRRNEGSGGTDFMWLNATEGLIVEDNYVHSMYAGGHNDGFQTGPDQYSLDPSIVITIRGNYFRFNGNPSNANAILFIDNANTILFESNYIAEHWGGLAPLRMWQDYSAATTVRYNVYDTVFKNEFSTGSSSFAIHYQNDAAPLATYACNRYADGSFIEQQYVGCDGGCTVTHDTTGCPSYP